MDRFLPCASFDHRIAIFVEQIETSGPPRVDLRHEPAHYVFEVFQRIAALHALGHARKQFAKRAVGIAFGLEALPCQAVFAENADSLRHVPDFVDLAHFGQLGSVVLGG